MSRPPSWSRLTGESRVRAALGRQVPKRLLGRPHQRRPGAPLVGENPLARDVKSALSGVVAEGGELGADRDQELGLACVRAWNQWHEEVWAAPCPGCIRDSHAPERPWLCERERRRSPVFVLHQLHRLSDSSAEAFEAIWRDDLMGALAQNPGIRLLWYATVSDISLHGEEAITMVGIRDTEALSHLAEQSRTGTLASLFGKLHGLRSDIESRLLKPLRHNRLKPDFDAIRTDAVEHKTAAYMHDFVAPRIGKRRGYEQAMEQIYMSLDVNAEISIWAGMEPVVGHIPEQLNISRIQSDERLFSLLTSNAPRERKQPGEWMHDALAVRDRWTTRLVRCTSWSPMY